MITDASGVIEYVNRAFEALTGYRRSEVLGRTPAIVGLTRVSKGGLRRYARVDELPRVLGGLGRAVLTTSSGVMTERDARKARVGGEIMCYVW